MSLPGIQAAQIMRLTQEKKETVDATRSSGLHYFITTLLLEKTASALDAFTVRPLAKTADDNRNAHIIELPPLDPQAHLGTSDCFILKDARFIERHLRIDAFFAPISSTNGQHPLPYCHYTETYEAPGDKRIVLHLYINKEGTVEHCQIKIVEATEGADVQPIKIVSYLSDAVANLLKPLATKNADIALKLIKKLNVQKLDKFLSLQKEVHDLDLKLSQLSRNLYKKKIRADYLKSGKKFIENIKVLNNLTDSRYADTRDVQIGRMCGRIEAGEFTPKTFEPAKVIEVTTEVDNQTESAARSVSEEAGLTTLAQKQQAAKNTFKAEINAQRTELWTLIKKDKEQLDPFSKKEIMDAKQLIERAKILDNLRDSLLAFYCLPNNSAETLGFIKDLEKKLEKIPTLLQSFEKLAKSGKVSEVSELYPYIQNNLNVSFLREFVCDLLYSSNNNLINGIAICDFLYDNSVLYRAVIEVLNTTFFEIREAPKGVGLSLLLSACHLNNRLAFEMLLRQGAHPNDAGLTQGDCIIPAIYAVFLKIKNETHLYYVERLLHYGSFLEFPNDYFRHFELLTSLKTTLKPNPAYATVINEAFTQIKAPSLPDKELHDDLMKALAKRTSALLAACTLEPTHQLINLLAPKSSLDGLLCSLAYLAMSRVEIKARFLPTSAKAGLHFYVNQAECDQDTMLHSKASNNSTTSMFLFYISEEHKINAELNGIVKHLVENFNKKYAQILAQNPKQLQTLKATLMRQAQEINDYIQKKMLYTACFYLQTCNSNPTILEKEEILQVCAESAKISLNTTQVAEWNSARTRCMWALGIVETTKQEYADHLKTTPAFTSLKKLLEEVNKQLKSPAELLTLAQIGNQAPITQTVKVSQKPTGRRG